MGVIALIVLAVVGLGFADRANHRIKSKKRARVAAKEAEQARLRNEQTDRENKLAEQEVLQECANLGRPVVAVRIGYQERDGSTDYYDVLAYSVARTKLTGFCAAKHKVTTFDLSMITNLCDATTRGALTFDELRAILGTVPKRRALPSLAHMSPPPTGEAAGIKMTLKYKDIDGDETERLIDAYMVAEGQVAGYCHMDHRLRTFDLARIQSAFEPDTGEVIPDVSAYIQARDHE